MSEGFAGGRIHIEPGHRIVAEAARARIFSDPERREAVDVKCDDFDGVVLYVAVSPEQKEVMRVSIFAPCFAQIKEAVGDRYFEELYHSVGSWLITRWVDLQVILNTSDRVDSSITQSSRRLVFILLTNEYLTWSDFHCLKQFNLWFGIGKIINDPSTNLAVTLFESLFDERIQDAVGNHFTIVPAILNNLTIHWVSLYLLFQHVFAAD